MSCECKKIKTKVRDAEECKKLVNRLNRIEGQVRGVRGMVENDAWCIDILTQVTAINSALSSFSRELLASHIKGCVADGIRSGEDEVLDELVETLGRFVR